MLQVSKKLDLQQLQAEWYQKLKEDGFADIENDERGLKRWSSHWSTRHTIEEIQAKIAYYQMADRFLAEHPFKSELEKVIWEYHTHAISVRDIATTLEKTGVFSISKTSVAKIVEELAHIMKTSYLAGYKEEN